MTKADLVDRVTALGDLTRRDGEIIATVRVSDQAVCTSGDYERPAAHILDPRNGAPSESVASATVIAPGAMLADNVSVVPLPLQVPPLATVTGACPPSPIYSVVG